jgi:hypothetical protein
MVGQKWQSVETYEELRIVSIARVSAIEEQEAAFGKATLPEICLNLRQAVNGAAEPWPLEDVNKAIVILSKRLMFWINGSEIGKRFDSAVYEMVAATLREVEHYLPEAIAGYKPNEENG